MDGKGQSCIERIEETPQEKMIDIFLFILFIALVVLLVFYVLYLMHSEQTTFEIIHFW